ncbi:MAG: hypothetical protein JNJ57_15960 [Saprospiraceae bacterium]|nr:hypothetical protein [Saprospiraceae bacterium]
MRYLIGPELFYALMYAGATLLGQANQPANKSLDSFIEKLWFWIPVACLLVFALWWIPSVEKRWLLLRVWITGIIGGHLVIERALRAYSEQGPGIGMGYLAGIMLQFILLVVGTIFIKIRF